MASSTEPFSQPGTTTPSSLAAKTGNPLSSKATTVLSSSYADTEFRDALALLDERGVLNTAETRRQLRLDVQKEVIDSNGEIIDEFAKVAEVGRHNTPSTQTQQCLVRGRIDRRLTPT